MHVILRSRPFVGSLIISVFIIYGSIKPDTGGTSILKFIDIPNIDKFIHILFYLILSLSLFFGFMKQPSETNRKTVYGFSLGFPIILGAMLEIIQWNYIASRHGEWLDLMANTAGILLAFLLYIGYNKWFISGN